MVFIIVQFGTEEGGFQVEKRRFKDHFNAKFEDFNVKKDLKNLKCSHKK